MERLVKTRTDANLYRGAMVVADLEGRVGHDHLVDIDIRFHRTSPLWEIAEAVAGYAPTAPLDLDYPW